MTGVIGSARQARVDATGLVTPWPEGWSLDWWVGADDRWHLPSRESGVRQRLVDSSPVIETAMRIPGGDAIQRAYAISGPQDLVVVEIENRSPVPFAIALALRPYNPGGLAAVESIALHGRTVSVNGEAALLLPKRPAAMAGGTGLGGDCLHIVTSGGAGAELDPVECPVGLGQAAFVFPLAHTATIRVAMPFDPQRRRRRRRSARPHEQLPSLDSPLPSGADVARGWAAQSRRGLRLDLPEGSLAEAVNANRKYLLLDHVGAGSARIAHEDQLVWLRGAADKVVALDQYGFHREAADVISHLPSGWRGNGFFVRHRQERDSKGPVLFAIAEHGRLTGHPDSEDADHPAEVAGDEAIERVQWMLERASGTYTWPEAVHPRPGGGHQGWVAACFLTLVRGLLVAEVPGGLALLSAIPAQWRGQPLEVHDAPTHHGRLSFAVRWHGSRPALLWELIPHSDGPHVLFTAPGLDPAWSSTELRGDALLSSLEDEADRR